MKVYPLEQRRSCGWRLRVAIAGGLRVRVAITTFRGWRLPLLFPSFPSVPSRQFAWTDGNVARESQHNTVNISVNTSCVESCTKTHFLEVVHPLNFSKNNFPLLKARSNSYLFSADLVFSLKAKVLHIPNHFEWARAWALVRCRRAMT